MPLHVAMKVSYCLYDVQGFVSILCLLHLGLGYCAVELLTTGVDDDVERALCHDR